MHFFRVNQPVNDVVKSIDEKIKKIKSFEKSSKVAVHNLPELIVVPHYSKLEESEAKKVFSPLKPNQRSVAIATNIAEASITFEDIAVCVDSGYCKESNFDHDLNLKCLNEVLISKDAAIQR